MPDHQPEFRPPTQSALPGETAVSASLVAARAAAAGHYEILGELGPGPGGDAVFLARRVDGGEILAVRLVRSPNAFPSLEEIRALDGSVPAPSITCPQCANAVGAWDRHCRRCGADVSGVPSGSDPIQALKTIVASASPSQQLRYDILGSMPRAASGAPVTFARDRANGALVTMHLVPAADGAAGAPTVVGVATVAPLAPTPVLERAVPDVGPAAPTVSPSPGGPTQQAGAGASATRGPAKAIARVCPQCGAEFDTSVRFCPTDGSTLLTRSPTEDLVGQIIGHRYEIKRKLGAGGMGEVYLAEQIKMRRLCALKVMLQAQVNDADAAGRFGREAHNASRITHPHVCAIYDFGETDDGQLYIAMEYVEGEPLSTLLAREVRLPIPRAVTIASQVAEALGAAHELGIVHRDLKPDNIMIAAHKRGGDTVKVVDFGIAKAFQAAGQRITKTGFIIGTPAYMSPEQITGDPLDGRSDVYSLGCVLFKMLTGAEAFDGPSGQAVLTRRLAEPPPHPRSLDPNIPVALDEVVVRALARLPQDRFESAEAFVDALSAASAPTPAPGPGIWRILRAAMARIASATGLAPDGAVPPGASSSVPLTPSAPSRSGEIAPAPRSPSLARPRVLWADSAALAGRSGTPVASGGASPAAAPVGVASPGIQPSPPAPWRPNVEPGAVVGSLPLGEGSTASASPGVLGKPVAAGRWAYAIMAVVVVLGGGYVARALAVQRSHESPAGRDSVVVANPSAPGHDSVVAPTTPPPVPPTSGIRAFQTAEVAALDVRDQAVGAGAISKDLEGGDSFRTRADESAVNGQFAAAVAQLNGAKTAWRRAEAAARERLKPVTPRPPQPIRGDATHDTPAPPQLPVNRSPDSTRPLPPPVVAKPLPGGSDTGGATHTTAADVRAVVVAYIAAVNARQMPEMRRLWPTMPDDAARGWQQWFKAATDLSVELVSTDEPTVNGPHAEMVVVYTIGGFIPSQGALPRRPLKFRTKFERDRWGWQILSMDEQK